ncbi:OPI3 Phosphatidyl-N-methylethanolamine N-methyltransferase [Candida maltosa Xu316]|uniref:Phosphatidyl-N-methylethanolamine N-methyltransferase n=1 Tax=Candida maltosa (strain Xu316) TaxID=1245528 RepID=M3HE12_CANMX|nr:Methylene-fatty-acyl-phospholipid synthase [Candida maltosa Xu316]
MDLAHEISYLPEQILYLIQNPGQYIEINNQLLYAVGCIAFNPIFWNIAARLEYNTHIITKLSFGSPKLGCYLLAITIFSLGIYRDHVYYDALMAQPNFAPFYHSVIIQALAVFCFGFGNVLVLSSMWALGVTGTYLGDYFGILMTKRVTGFPFNINDNPMYNGSTLCFLGTALWYAKPSGVVVALFVFVMYKIALLFEEPFTAKIYARRAKLD